MFFFRIIKKTFDMVLVWLVNLRTEILYDDFTIADYFRKKGARIGKDCQFMVRWLGDEPFLVEIGNHVFISRGVVLHTSGDGWIAKIDDPGVRIFGKIVIEDNCFIGFNAQIMPDVRIGKNSMVGAGSVVIKDVPPNSVVMGVPARVIGSSIKYKEKIIADWNKRKPPGWPYKSLKETKSMLQKYYRDNQEQEPHQ